MHKMRYKLLFALLLQIQIAAIGCGGRNALNDSLPEASDAENEFKSIFDGITLAGWQGDSLIWRVEDGNLIGQITPERPLEANSFLIWEDGQPADFELKLDFKISVDGNSGVNYRSEPVRDVPFALRGYQADIDGRNRYTGQNYEERKRTTLAYRGQQTKINPQDPPGDVRQYVERNAWKGLEVTNELGSRDALGEKIIAEDWNSLHLIIKGNVLQHYVNGILMSEVVDEDPVNRRADGLLGLQVHVGPPMTVMFRNIELKKL